MKNGGKKILTWRKAHGQTQAEVAEAAHVSPEAVARYESGSLSPGIMVAIRIELLTGGEVSLEDWGLDVFSLLQKLVTLRRRSVTPSRRALREGT